jgi:hypothetical protein
LKPWYFGNFGTVLFLLSPARAQKLRWFRDTYEFEIKNKDVGLGEGELPSIVAHSFGTYILGHALLKYPFIRFDKVLLCGSILPRDFPWTALIERGQVQAVRNEYGTQDIWSNFVSWFVRGSGPSGIRGFTSHTAERFEQAEFRYPHSEYFSEGHMERYWLPFLERPLATISQGEGAASFPTTSWPWAFYGALALLLAVTVLGVSSAIPLLPGYVPVSRARLSNEERHTIVEAAVGELTPLVEGAAAREKTGRCSEYLNAPGPPDFGPWTTAQCALALMAGSEGSVPEVLRGLEFLSAAHVDTPWSIELTTWAGMAFLRALSHPSPWQSAARNSDWIEEVRHAYDDVSARQSVEGGWGSFNTAYADSRAMTPYATYQALQFLLAIKKRRPYILDETALDGQIKKALRWILLQYDDKARGWSEHDSTIKPDKGLATLYLVVLSGGAQAGFDRVASDRNYEEALNEWIATAVVDSQSRKVTDNSQLRQTQFMYDENSQPLGTKSQGVGVLWFPWTLWLSDLLAADRHLSASRERQIDLLQERLIRRLPEAVAAFKTGSTYPAAELLYVVGSLRQRRDGGVHVGAASK